MNEYRIKLNLTKLKIKAKSLAEEARIIKKEERKQSRVKYSLSELTDHRKGIVRQHARATQLAVAFIKGLPYSKIENSCVDYAYRDYYIIPKVETMVKKYGDRTNEKSVKDWFYE